MGKQRCQGRKSLFPTIHGPPDPFLTSPGSREPLTASGGSGGVRRKGLRKDFCGKKSNSSAGVSERRQGLVFLAQVERYQRQQSRENWPNLATRVLAGHFWLIRESGNGWGWKGP